MKRQLDAIAASFGMSNEQRQLILREEATAVLSTMLTEAIADGRFTSEEETRLKQAGESLGIEIAYSDTDKAALDRMRLLARIDEGQLPELIVPITLKRGEMCHAVLDVHQYQLRTVTKSIGYSGPSARIRIMKGVSWRVGSVSVRRYTEDVMTHLDTGRLYLTNKRLSSTVPRKTPAPICERSSTLRRVLTRS